MRTERAWGASARISCSGLSSCATQCRAVPGTRALSCRAVPNWRCSSRASSARSRWCGSHARNTREPHRQRHSALSGLGGWRSPPGLGTVAVCRLAMRRTGTRALSCRAVPHWRCYSHASSTRSRVTRGTHVAPVDSATAHGAGLGAGADLASSALLLHGAERDAVPARALYLAVPSQTGGAPTVPPAHARATVAVTRGTRVGPIDSATAHGAGLGAGARLPSSALSPRDA